MIIPKIMGSNTGYRGGLGRAIVGRMEEQLGLSRVTLEQHLSAEAYNKAVVISGHSGTARRLVATELYRFYKPPNQIYWASQDQLISRFIGEVGMERIIEGDAAKLYLEYVLEWTGGEKLGSAQEYNYLTSATDGNIKFQLVFLLHCAKSLAIKQDRRLMLENELAGAASILLRYVSNSHPPHYRVLLVAQDKTLRGNLEEMMRPQLTESSYDYRLATVKDFKTRLATAVDEQLAGVYPFWDYLYDTNLQDARFHDLVIKADNKTPSGIAAEIRRCLPTSWGKPAVTVPAQELR